MHIHARGNLRLMQTNTMTKKKKKSMHLAWNRRVVPWTVSPRCSPPDIRCGPAVLHLLQRIGWIVILFLDPFFMSCGCRKCFGRMEAARLENIATFIQGILFGQPSKPGGICSWSSTFLECCIFFTMVDSIACRSTMIIITPL